MRTFIYSGDVSTRPFVGENAATISRRSDAQLRKDRAERNSQYILHVAGFPLKDLEKPLGKCVWDRCERCLAAWRGGHE